MTKNSSAPGRLVSEEVLTLTFNGSDWNASDLHTWSVSTKAVPGWLRFLEERGDVRCDPSVQWVDCTRLHVEVPLEVNASGLLDGLDDSYTVVLTAHVQQPGGAIQIC